MPEERPQRRSIESYGQGQSGYTAGRVEGDRSLDHEIKARNDSYFNEPDELDELSDDERFSGCGGRRWAPPESETAKRPKE